MNNQVNEVLKKIREVCDLKRLEFGAEVEEKPAFGSSFRDLEPEGGKWTATVKDNTGAWMFPCVGGFARVKESELKWHTIIGLPVQLNHLLLALIQTHGCIETDTQMDNTLMMNEMGTSEYVKYDLTKNVEDNLHSNPELTKWVHGVIIDN